MDHRRMRARETGFTIVETMVAVLILLVGVLGTVKLVTAAGSVGKTTRSREAATNLSREIAEAARTIDYDALLTATAPAALQALSGFADSDTSTAGWQMSRRGVTYTIALTACIYDDAKDGSFSGNTGPSYCAGFTPGTTDANGDDYRKLEVRVGWSTRDVKLTTSVVNPAGGFGPRITHTPTTGTPPTVSTPAPNAGGTILALAGTNSVGMQVKTTSATGFSWDAGNAKDGGQLANAAGQTTWDFTWPLKSVGSFSCSTTPAWVPDAPAYQMTFQPTDSSGTPGDLRTQVVSVDRSAPHQLCDFAGGRNPRHGGVVDLQWRKSFEGDVSSYSVWRVASPDVLVCNAVTAAECSDTSPPAGGGAIGYYVKPKQTNSTPGSLGSIFGPQTDLAIPADSPANAAPDAPTGVAVTAGTKPTISWTLPTDSDGTISSFRIYRDGVALANRYGRTTNGTTTSFTDTDTGGTVHTYSVSAIDDDFAESALVAAL